MVWMILRKEDFLSICGRVQTNGLEVHHVSLKHGIVNLPI